MNLYIYYVFVFLTVTRIQFYAIEIARNREGHNQAVWKKSALKVEEKTEDKDNKS